MYERDADRAKEAMQEIMRKGPLKTLVIIGAVAVFLLFLRPWVQVGAGERGIVMNFGAVQKVVLAEGLHFRIPVMQEIVLMDVKVQKALTDADAASSNLQDVSSKVALNYHVIPDKANIVYQNIGIHFKERIIDPAILEVVKAVSARYSAEELITKRPAVSEAMRAALMERLLVHNIGVDAFSITSFNFSRTFIEAIESIKDCAKPVVVRRRPVVVHAHVRSLRPALEVPRETRIRDEMDLVRLELELVDERRFGNGLVYLHHRART